jgi:hypothetical protein
MIFNIHVQPDVQLLKFAVLLNQYALMSDATQSRGVGYLDNTVPTGQGEIQSPCASVSSFNTAQVLSGVADVDSTGEATIDIVGVVPSYVQYPSNGDRTPVNVMQMLPGGGDTASSAASGRCSVNLVNWEQVGAVPWQTPTYLGGQVAIGSVPAGRYIESSNPPVVDAQSLSWNIDGPADVSYTLFDSNAESSHGIWLFWAGITAALAAALVVEVVKGSVETTWLFRRRDREHSNAEGSEKSPHSSNNVLTHENPRGTAKEKTANSTVFVIGLLSGVAINERRRRNRSL